jgi:hypothetical protein
MVNFGFSPLSRFQRLGRIHVVLHRIDRMLLGLAMGFSLYE